MGISLNLTIVHIRRKGENIMCEYCNAKVYVKAQKIMKDILAPFTHTEELRQELEDLTGESITYFT